MAGLRLAALLHCAGDRPTAAGQGRLWSAVSVGHCLLLQDASLVPGCVVSSHPRLCLQRRVGRGVCCKKMFYTKLT